MHGVLTVCVFVADCEVSPVSPACSPGPGGGGSGGGGGRGPLRHGGSFHGKPRGSRLARRARSFKDDFLEILSQMRSPGGAGGASSGGSTASSRSPQSPKARTPLKVTKSDASDSNPLQDLDAHVKQVRPVNNALFVGWGRSAGAHHYVLMLNLPLRRSSLP